MPRTPRRRLAKGIFADKYSLTGVARVGGRPIERAFPPDTPLEHIKRWQTRMDIQYGESDLSPVRGTLAADCERYLERVKKRPASWKSKRSELKAWCAAGLGRKPRHTITPTDIDRTIATWTAEGVAPKTIVNRCRTLRHLYTTLAEDKHAHTPLDNVDVPQPPKRRPVSVDAATIKRVEKALRAGNPKNRARFMVMASTGIRPAQLRKVQPEGVDLKKKLVIFEGGKGGLPIVHALNDDMAGAWRAFVAADAWGHFDSTSLARRIREAGWPPGVRVYNTRHSVGMELSERGVDLGDIQAWLGHADISTTRQTYVPMLISRMQKMAAKLDGRLGWGQVPHGIAPRRGTDEQGRSRVFRGNSGGLKIARKVNRPVRSRAKQAGKH